MHRRLALLLALGFATGLTGVAQAAKVEHVEVKGLDEAMTENVMAALSLEAAKGKVVSGRRFGYLVRVATEETREALEPFGYYSPVITVQRSDRSSPEGSGTNSGSQPAAGAVPAATSVAGAAQTIPLAGADANASTDQPAAASIDPGSTTAAETPSVDASSNPGASSAAGSTRSTRPVSVTITVNLGQPVKVRNETVGIEGEGGDDRYLARDLRDFQPKVGDVLDHTRYEASKTLITRRLAERGYFDADFVAHRVEVTRAEHAADIDLRWASGHRYNMGPITFTQTPKQIIRPTLLDKLVYWQEGEYYHQGRLDRLRESLLRLDYFSAIDLEPHPEQANANREVPVTVTLTPAKRTVYSAGLSYGTDSGSGVSLGMERRYLNDRGHKGLFQIDWLQKRKTATLQYRVPAFAWLDGWYTGSAQYADEQTDYIDSRRIELVASRSGQYNRHLNLVAAMHALRERWAYAVEENDDDPDTPTLYTRYTYASYLFPSVNAEYTNVDDRFAPRRGIGGNLMLRAGAGSASAESSGNNTFAQLHTRASWFKGLGPNDRLIVRGEFGHTFTKSVDGLPPSLRFYAGGDRSIRGYNWREVGPRTLDRNGKLAFALGAKNVITASVEYERYFFGPWGGAVFVDSGDAFDGGSPDWHTGVGFGVRWKSPVGPVKVDLARGLKNPDSPFTISLSIGSDL